MTEVDTRALKHDHSFIIMPTSNPPCFPKANMIEGRLHVSYFASTCSINMAMLLSDREWLYNLISIKPYYFSFAGVCVGVSGSLSLLMGAWIVRVVGAVQATTIRFLACITWNLYTGLCFHVLSLIFVINNWYCTVQFWDMFLLQVGLWRVRSSDDFCDVVIGMARYAMQSRLLFYFHMCKTRAEELLWDRRPTGFWRLPKRMLAQSRMQAHFQRV